MFATLKNHGLNPTGLGGLKIRLEMNKVEPKRAMLILLQRRHRKRGEANIFLLSFYNL